ncbi:TonB-dependent receptor plug domain-containing protein [Chondromyces crocatus]|uniref:TonB-dependent receptor plug domain-containing protein n=1 Tax=Chondromyces crocatus TaxID=52 RepID=UPI001FDFDF79|nr:TonB-dependent receptor [Chondromyces crocatus]
MSGGQGSLTRAKALGGVLFSLFAATTEAAAQAPPPPEAPSTPPAEAPPREAAPSASGEAPSEIVVTGTRTPESVQRATVRTDVVTRKEAERRGATNVAEALEGQLGVQVNPGAYGALGNPSAIQIQGFDRDRVLVLEDGERVIGDVGGAIDLSSLPLTDVARVEVVAGPMSALYGASAIGGVVNVISAPPALLGLSGRVRLEGRLRPGFLLQGSSAYRGDDTWAGADVTVEDRAGVPFEGNEPALLAPARKQRAIGLRAGTAIGSRINLRARARWLNDVSEGTEVQRIPGLGDYVLDLPSVSNRVALHLAEDIDLRGGSNLRLTVGRQWIFQENRKDRRDSPLDEVRDREGTMQSMEAIATIVDGKTRTWVIGARAEMEELTQRITKTETDGTSLSTHETEEVPLTRLGVAALYSQFSWKPFDELTIMPGIRGEMHLRYGGVIAPRLSIAYRPTSRLSLRLAGGRGFRAPSAKELGFLFDHSFYGYRVIGNPDLSPEASWGVTGDVSLKITDEVSFRAGGFVTWIDDLIDFALDPSSSFGGIDTYSYSNVAKARTSGVDARVTLRPFDWLSAELGYAYLWTRDDTNERPLSGRPPHTVMAALRADLPADFELVARFRAVTSTFVDEDLRSPGFNSLDLRLARGLWSGAQAYIGMRNALAARREPGRMGDQRPFDGRAVYLGLIAELPSEEP